MFEDMWSGGITAANCTCSVWEGFHDTMMNVARLKRQIEESDDILLQVRCVEDIHRAKMDGKVGIILGWQNLSGIEDRIPFLRVFRDLGVLAMQLTYNTQNLVGSGCWEVAGQRPLRFRPGGDRRDEPSRHPDRSVPRRLANLRGGDRVLQASGRLHPRGAEGTA